MSGRVGPLPPSFNNTYSLAFDGIDDYIETTKTTALTTASLSMWVKVSGNFGVNERQSLAGNDDFNHGRDFVIADTPLVQMMHILVCLQVV